LLLYLKSCRERKRDREGGDERKRASERKIEREKRRKINFQ
jgi:hypothetical protein